MIGSSIVFVIKNKRKIFIKRLEKNFFRGKIVVTSPV